MTRAGRCGLRWYLLMPVLPVLAVLHSAEVAQAQILTYPDPCLYSIYPSGAARGTIVDVELRGGQNGLDGATGLVIDGPPGITVEEFKCENAGLVKARLKVADDAVAGRRFIRVHGGSSGLTNFRYFFVGALPELLESEQNNTPETAQHAELPVIINGRFSPALDVDCYRFEAKQGQSLVAAVQAYGIDSFVNIRQGYLDTSLELLDASGAVVAAADDTLGPDPLLQLTIPANGSYSVRLQSVGFKGSDHAAYRLTLGAVPYPVAAFPPGAQRGHTIDVELSGPNIPTGTRQPVADTTDGFLLQHVSLADPAASTQELPFVRGEYPEIVEQEPNNSRETATPLNVSSTANGRFLAAGDEDWYRLTLQQGESVILQTMAQRYLHSPVDTQIEFFDSSGRRISLNDDGRPFHNGVQCAHDFRSTDSWMVAQAPAAGDFFIRVRNRSGSVGPRAVYRLTVEPLKPDLTMYQWPDAVPVWGPGTSATFIVELIKWGGIESDISVAVEGLPAGWTGSVANWPVGYMWAYNENHAIKLLLTVTAPSDARIGDMAAFRVVARFEHKGEKFEREAQYGTLYGNGFNDRMLVRASPMARAVVARPLDCWLETSVTELTTTRNSTVNIPVKIHRTEGSSGTLGLVVNGPTVAAGCGWNAPVTLPADATEFSVPFAVGNLEPGTHSIVVARSWSSDIRSGRPGPCTRMIRLNVKSE